MKYEGLSEKSAEQIEAIWEKLEAKLSRLAEKSYDLIPYTTENGKHTAKKTGSGEIANAWWTNGFWGGLMWLMWKETGKECYFKTARHAGKLLDKAWEEPEKLHHDVGFMWHITAGADFALTGDEDAKKTLLRAADLLLARYHEKGGFIVAWNGEEKKDLSIIDTMMNLALLYRATEITGDEKYAACAIRHADMAMRYHVRGDGSVAHIVRHSLERDEMLETLAGQGYAVGSSWSRGAAWALYGFTLSYLHTKKAEYLDVAKRVAHYFLACTAKTEYLPLLDFRAPTEPVWYDSTAGAIAACGLIEIARLVPEYEKALYRDGALSLLTAMEKAFCDFGDKEDGILLMGSERYSQKQHIHIIYGDYYFTEAILKLRGSDFLPW